jgi:undecaprenol kinase
MSVFIKSMTRSFKSAWRGLLRAFKTERTFQVMVAAALVIFILLATLPLASSERLVILLVTGLVLVLELLNTMVERLIDLLKPRLSAYVKDVKDLMAAAVLIAAVFASIIAVVILFPHVMLLLGSI